MGYNLKPVKCENCKYWRRYRNTSDGNCQKDGRFSREFYVCNLLETNQDRREAKINLYK